MKILTILGTRPEIIRLSRIIPKLDNIVNHHVLHTMQNFHPKLSDIFFEQLKLRKPDTHLPIESTATLAQQLSKILIGIESCIDKFRPDKVLILGDTNSSLGAIICARLGIPVYHMEAGNRCFDLSVPEEINRRLIDTASTVNMPYTQISKEHLIKEGHNQKNIFVTGNPIKEVIDYYKNEIHQSMVLNNLNLKPQEYVLVTAHRAENVDNQSRLDSIIQALNEISLDYPVIFSCHPRTRLKLHGMKFNNYIKICEPFGFFDFIKLEQNCRICLTDSGTVQEELCILGKRGITIRNSTERIETVSCGSNIVSGLNTQNIILAYKNLLAATNSWNPCPEYLIDDVSDIVVNILLSNILH